MLLPSFGRAVAGVRARRDGSFLLVEAGVVEIKSLDAPSCGAECSNGLCCHMIIRLLLLRPAFNRGVVEWRMPCHDLASSCRREALYIAFEHGVPGLLKWQGPHHTYVHTRPARIENFYSRQIGLRVANSIVFHSFSNNGVLEDL